MQSALSSLLRVRWGAAAEALPRPLLQVD